MQTRIPNTLTVMRLGNTFLRFLLEEVKREESDQVWYGWYGWCVLYCAVVGNV